MVYVGTLQIWRAKDNARKFLDVRTYRDGHIYIVKYIRSDSGEKIRQGGKARHRISKKRFEELSTDYTVEKVILL